MLDPEKTRPSDPAPDRSRPRHSKCGAVAGARWRRATETEPICTWLRSHAIPLSLRLHPPKQKPRGVDRPSASARLLPDRPLSDETPEDVGVVQLLQLAEHLGT